MGHCQTIDQDSANSIAAIRELQTHGSGLVEQVLEYQFLAALTPELLRRGMRFEVLRGDFDLDGHDLVIEAGGTMRHIQLKGMALGGRTARVPVNTRLGTKPSGCVVWMGYDPQSFAITGWRWFGGLPGERLPDMGERIARHTRANSAGVKAERPHIRMLTARQFTQLPDIAALADQLFGAPATASLLQHLQETGADVSSEPWLPAVQVGVFSAIPQDLDWNSSVHLAHLIDGYALAQGLGLGDPMAYADQQLQAATATGRWRGDAAALWITLFLEHRRWRFSAPFGPDPAMTSLLDGLVHQLRTALVRIATQ